MLDNFLKNELWKSLLSLSCNEKCNFYLKFYLNYQFLLIAQQVLLTFHAILHFWPSLSSVFRVRRNNTDARLTHKKFLNHHKGVALLSWKSRFCINNKVCAPRFTCSSKGYCIKIYAYQNTPNNCYSTLSVRNASKIFFKISQICQLL